MLLSAMVFFAGCKKFLDVTPIDDLSGNTYWKTQKDVEAFTNGLYVMFKQKVGAEGYFAVGDLRCSPITSSGGNNYISHLQNNDLRNLSTSYGALYRNVSNWSQFYNIIAGANILYKKIDEVPDPSLTADLRLRYKAEAVFVRNLCYFFMVRLYGDVPYTTEVYNSKPLPRTPMITVIKNCLEDLAKVKQDLPWVYEDASKIGIRAMRGSVIALMAHLNMWAAGFDEDGNKTGYYTAVQDLGKEIETTTDYQLLPYNPESNRLLFKGRTKESLFEIYQNFNAGEKLSFFSNIGYLLSHYPLLGPSTMLNSRAFYAKKWMAKIYSDAVADGRKELWFVNREADNGSFQFMKFSNAYAQGVQILNDDDIMIFRLPDMYLLAAEANANLGQEIEARRYLAMVRNRAGAEPIVSSGRELLNDILDERTRELMGEGHYYYDLVRTKRILDENMTFRPISVSDFNAGAWTWPIDPSALIENPNMILNNFWR